MLHSSCLSHPQTCCPAALSTIYLFQETQLLWESQLWLERRFLRCIFQYEGMWQASTPMNPAQAEQYGGDWFLLTCSAEETSCYFFTSCVVWVLWAWGGGCCCGFGGGVVFVCLGFLPQAPGGIVRYNKLQQSNAQIRNTLHMGLPGSPPFSFKKKKLKHFAGLLLPTKHSSFNSDFCCLYKNQGHGEIHFSFPDLNIMQSSVVKRM